MKSISPALEAPPRFPLFKALAGVPAPLGGLALGISSLGGAWGIYLPEQAALFKAVATPIAAVLVLLVLLKYLLHPKLIRTDIEHTVVSSVMPTLAMASMVIAFNAHSLFPVASRVLWMTAVVAHLCLLGAFLWHRSRDFHMKHMVPSWFVPPVGIIVACVTSSTMGFPALANVLFFLGAGAYAIELPVMLYRLTFHERITEAASPTFAIMAAPASLTLAGYLTISGQDANLYLVAVLTPIAVLMTCLVWLAMIRLLRLPFSPGYAAFTFPMVIGATALLKLNALLSALGIDYPQGFLTGLAQLELYVATAIVTYVALRYSQHYLKR